MHVLHQLESWPCHRPAAFPHLQLPPACLQDGFAVGGQLSIADTFLFHLVELHQTKYGAEFDEAYPALAAHYAKIAALPSMAAYLASPARLAR